MALDMLWDNQDKALVIEVGYGYCYMGLLIALDVNFLNSIF